MKPVKRTMKIVVRVSPEEMQRLDRGAQHASVAMSTWIRMLALHAAGGQKPRVQCPDCRRDIIKRKDGSPQAHTCAGGRYVSPPYAEAR